MKNMLEMLTTESLVHEALIRLGRDYRLLVTPSGQMKAYVEIPANGNVDTYEARFWKFLSELRGPGKVDRLVRGVQRGFDPSGVQFVTKGDIKEDRFLARVFHRKEPQEVLNVPHLERWLDPGAASPPSLEGRPSRIVFYSYKGGMGRTTALILCAIALANVGKKVAVIDFDLEAPGLASTLVAEGALPQRGVVDFLIGFPAILQWELAQQVEYLNRHLITVPYGFPGGGSITLWGAGIVDTFYPQKLAHVSLEHVHRLPTDPVQTMFRLVEEQVPGVEYILIDSRTGLADIGGSLLFQYADVACTFLQHSPQNLDGLRVFVEKLAQDRRDNPVTAPDVVWVDSHTRTVKSPAEKTANLRIEIGDRLREHGIDQEPEVLQLPFNELLADIGPNLLRDEAKAVTERNPVYLPYLALMGRVQQAVAQRKGVQV